MKQLFAKAVLSVVAIVATLGGTLPAQAQSFGRGGDRPAVQQASWHDDRGRDRDRDRGRDRGGDRFYGGREYYGDGYYRTHHGRDAAIIGGSAVAGALIGGAAGHGTGAAVGAVIGGIGGLVADQAAHHHEYRGY